MNSTGQRFIAKRRKLEGIRKQALETGRNRLLITGMFMAMAFSIIAGRLVELAVYEGGYELRVQRATPGKSLISGRANIVDRNGMIIATSLPTVSMYVDPAAILDSKEAAEALVAEMPGWRYSQVLAKLKSNGRFVWLARNLTPKQHHRLNRLGLPGIGFHNSERRVYPHGELISHTVGLTDVDGRGVAGLERYFDNSLRRSTTPLRTSIDLRVQSLLRDELLTAMKKFKAIGAAGVVMEVNSGEVVAMVSLPDYDPNKPENMEGNTAFNRATKGVYEMGSTFKLFTAAMALDSGTVRFEDGYDASKPIRVARFTISDYHAKNRWLTVPEIVLHSSNIGAAKMAIDVGAGTQRHYLKKFGLLQPARLELPEIGSPLLPTVWRPINTMTISYGHGISVSPVQLASAVAALVNGGIYRKPTLLKQAAQTILPGVQVITKKTSDQIRGLMRLVVTKGTGRKANVRGYLVGGKTGTAEKTTRRGYSKTAKLSSFVGVFPMDRPRYVLLAIVDEPTGNKLTYNYATGGWVAAPIIGKVVARMAPILGVVPTKKNNIKYTRSGVQNPESASLDWKFERTSEAVYEPHAGRWVEEIADAVGITLSNQTIAEEKLVIRTRKALTRAVKARAKRRQLLTTAVSIMELDSASR